MNLMQYECFFTHSFAINSEYIKYLKSISPVLLGIQPNLLQALQSTYICLVFLHLLGKPWPYRGWLAVRSSEANRVVIKPRGVGTVGVGGRRASSLPLIIIMASRSPQPGPSGLRSNHTQNNYQSISNDPPKTLKLLLIGSSSVGKSSLLLRFTDEVFLSAEEASATIGVDFKVKMINRRGKRYKLSIWDTAGQERFRTLTSSYYRGAHGVLLVYDVTNRESFESLPSWFSELDTFTHAPHDVVRAIVGNKVDKDYSRSVSTEEGRAFATDNHAMFFETSVKTKKGVEEVFEAVVDKIIDTPSLYQPRQGQLANSRMLPGGLNLGGPSDEDEGSAWCAC
ncbi:hypothetical protein O181_010921 [Austropuccinia psidii MF-1]|uniref:Ras-related protein Rab-18 n=1 Tax=Austropuccinia psidii MF-1 TaxID=1389203 RepID=A0A9Q3GKV7_9BASI|nr:hypothetical protein [Austropuccinia psidii MF-1]